MGYSSGCGSDTRTRTAAKPYSSCSLEPSSPTHPSAFIISHFDMLRHYDHTQFRVRDRGISRCPATRTIHNKVTIDTAKPTDDAPCTLTTTSASGYGNSRSSCKTTCSATSSSHPRSCPPQTSTSPYTEVPTIIAKMIDDDLRSHTGKVQDVDGFLDYILDDIYEATAEHHFWNEPEGYKKLVLLLSSYPQLAE